MRNKKSGVVENFLRWLSLPEEQHKKLLSQCEGILTKHGTDDICSELEVIFRSVLENKKQLRKRPRVSDGCTEKPEAKLSSRTLGSPDCSVQEVKLRSIIPSIITYENLLLRQEYMGLVLRRWVVSGTIFEVIL
ncbi:hypothetical protein TNIN_36891 [Trichonephila inaurata madagascariensis]|uniref:Uncharacterized protein n=1 Tax=Trichonephila inaurata madagascariensis TaxID=2747483 RepID=A0A8X6Y482_9ARAC|nr:hypothetical protein TNIN_36891 [Trichonephila inaurata madagascariensis]